MSLNYGEILKKAFNYTKNNRSLWFFGFILVLFGGGGGFAFPNFNINLGSDFFQKKRKYRSKAATQDLSKN